VTGVFLIIELPPSPPLTQTTHTIHHIKIKSDHTTRQQQASLINANIIASAMSSTNYPPGTASTNDASGGSAAPNNNNNDNGNNSASVGTISLIGRQDCACC
jgi:hypothetical protein